MAKEPRDDKEGRAHLGCPCPAPLSQTHLGSADRAVGTGFVWVTACSGHLQELHNLENPVLPSCLYGTLLNKPVEL